MDAVVTYRLDNIEIEGESVPVISRDDQSLGLDALEVLFGLAETRGPEALNLILQIAADWWDDNSQEAAQEASERLLAAWQPTMLA